VNKNSYKICEIFYSIQGESDHIGRPCIFIRFAGCNLNCAYCDTSYAQRGGHWLTLADILDHIAQYPCRLVELTGGEPLLQNALPLLLDALTTKGYKVLVETNGSIDITPLKGKAVAIMDIKCPSSGHHQDNMLCNLLHLVKEDQVKFVIANIDDYRWAKELLSLINNIPAKIIFSPVFSILPPQQLCQWILNDGLDVIFQLQIHKFIWEEDARAR